MIVPVIHVYCEAFGYSDDILLASSTVYGVKHMYTICQEYANEYEIRFSPAKFQLLSGKTFGFRWVSHEFDSTLSKFHFSLPYLDFNLE